MIFFAKYNGVETYSNVCKEIKGTSFCETRLKINSKYDICPFCQKTVTKGSIILLFNNWKLFPNVIAHNDCCKKFPNKEDAIKFLHEDYQEALKYKHWFIK
jgi:hypothetical protein